MKKKASPEHIKVVKRMSREGQSVQRYVSVQSVCNERLIMDGRVYVGVCMCAEDRVMWRRVAELRRIALTVRLGSILPGTRQHRRCARS